ncbi:conserved Plasmodium protein, unknown function [Plasmodium knowlesi strain H]|uniref:Uncharacterized protein n=3 Tax=Plasmodium knowlesi TaxID=5850 RepID=A0A5K1TYL6_PLAKH|nr:conserved Plasmodium protein, unknown function [Plasmodium knowlesi strain H]OTN64735.1 Uncharacterized protein PKNOH_S130206100 [Plasmodium knowlesi]CAA9989222.1 conserved Plasmodium protein, unknown function [Plasmodium knowlesi strain H]SBO26221.1 conserved Plasmodium protein, unknown function [Plasmodium knowlesi strain H]SBO27189.1 conserved Plasmodium protein, unknown function [Plasmodium knowlesi strain H]VVS78696.1 conserved Plasmodium protein, unknown function [Plasmodium knowlesi |eukprot:XP_002261567.1 hypothetical protein, conserved in Plasmodium species [Plasmodium knowlesi strain H]
MQTTAFFPPTNSLCSIIQVNCLSENHSNILYKCLSSDESLKQNEMYKHVNISGSLIKIITTWKIPSTCPFYRNSCFILRVV